MPRTGGKTRTNDTNDTKKKVGQEKGEAGRAGDKLGTYYRLESRISRTVDLLDHRRERVQKEKKISSQRKQTKTGGCQKPMSKRVESETGIQ